MASAEAPKETPRDPAKSAAPPVTVKKSKPETGDDEDGAGAGPAPGAKVKMLSTGLSRAVVLATVIASLVLLATGLFGNRFELVPAPNSVNGYAYRLDRLTGALKYCGPQQCSDVSQK